MAKSEKNRVVVLRESLDTYLSSVFGEDAELVSVRELGAKETGKSEVGDLKGFGYGTPYVIVVKTSGGVKRIVLETMRMTGGFGHDHFSDRAGILLWQHSAFNKLPRHVRSVDVGAFTKRQDLKSLGDCEEFFIVTEFADGKLYHEDLDRIKVRKKALSLDLERCRALSNYLAEIHKVKRDESELYVRRIRDLVGHGECIMGLIDSYPSGLAYVSEEYLEGLEKRCVEWRWKLKRFSHRLAQVHGDFHPWNILFQEDTGFTVLDRSRGEWGEPADDVSSMTVNYLFYSLQTFGKLEKPFESLFSLFWKNYLDKTGDEEILRVVQPFYVWRSLVVASPVWYPNLQEDVRVKLLNFARNMLDTEKLDLKAVNSYFEP